MPERITIRDFAGIKEIDVDLRQINVLIGPQATGKSITAKTLYYFKSFIGDMLNSIINEQNKRKLDSDFIQKFNLYFPMHETEQKPYFLRYEANDQFIQIEQSKGKPRLTYSDYYKKSLNTWKSYLRNSLERADEDEEQEADHYSIVMRLRRDFYATVSRDLGNTSAYAQVFIPAGRSFFAILQSSIFTFLASNNAIDPFLTEFGSYYESIKLTSRRVSSVRTRETEKDLRKNIESLIESILKGKYLVEEGADFLLTRDGRKINIANSSSGQQEMLPLSLILSAIPFIRRFDSLGSVVYIEEPEAHLFPSAQQQIVDLLATIYNNSRMPVQFIITTHSPYILAAINNLLQAGSLHRELSQDEQKKLEEIIPRNRFLTASDMSVYSLNEGASESILSSETGLISTNILDEVSDYLALQFDRLLDIE